jgi:tetratricopeptide (TPR) repeat protein
MAAFKFNLQQLDILGAYDRYTKELEEQKKEEHRKFVHHFIDLCGIPDKFEELRDMLYTHVGDIQKVEEALVPGYLNPPTTFKYANAVQILESSKLYDTALKYAQIAVQFNPDSFDAWRILYFVTKSSPEEKALALENMKRLDPKNPNVIG